MSRKHLAAFVERKCTCRHCGTRDLGTVIGNQFTCRVCAPVEYHETVQASIDAWLEGDRLPQWTRMLGH